MMRQDFRATRENAKGGSPSALTGVGEKGISLWVRVGCGSSVSVALVQRCTIPSRDDFGDTALGITAYGKEVIAR